MPDDVALEKAVLKPRRGRRCKPSEAEQQDVPQNEEVPQADTAKEADADKVSPGRDENESDTMKSVPQVPGSSPEVETSACKDTKLEVATAQKKSVRGRKPKVVPSKSNEGRDPVVLAPVREGRGRKAEATAPPAVRQTTRSRKVKPLESSNSQPEVVPEKALETTRTGISADAVSDQTPPVDTQKEDDSAASTEKTGMKTARGRKAKAPAEKNVNGENPVTDAATQKSVPSLGKARRGRKPTLEAGQNTVVSVETKQQLQPPVGAKRGRKAKVEEEKLEISDATASVGIPKPQEPVKKLRKTRKMEQDRVEPSNIQTAEVAVAEEAEAPLVAEPPKVNKPAVKATRTTRGGQKSKTSAECETVVKEVPADKLQRGRRGRQATAGGPEGTPKQELDTEKVDPSVGVRRMKKDPSLAGPAKRARRGASPPGEETKAESTVLISESGKRGRRPAAKCLKDVTVTNDTANPADGPSEVKEDAQKSKRSVKWKNSIEVFEILNVTPEKPVRGRKSKLRDQVDAKSQKASKNTSKTEEKDLSDRAAAARPSKRARGGPKAVSETVNEDESTNGAKNVEAEPQPKIRRGRSAKK
ncbi:protein bangles and beads-like [Brachionichthys hirsutus]|uniref:protein bangles and beads-like n=1 Tax=Brachionichthys hirsutus TaxID=412623 RepID=UPI0036045DCA